MQIKDLLTVVIPAKNEQNYIFHALYSLAIQEGIDGTRVVVADANSTDNTVNRVNLAKQLYEGKLNIEIIEGGMPSVARNRGARIANTKYVLFMDADVRLSSERNVIDNIETMEKLELDLMGCKADSYACSLRSKLAYCAFNVFNSFFCLFQPFCVGAYFMTRASKFWELGGFSETCTVSEDYMLSKHYDTGKFRISDHYYGQDNRRFRKYGYFNMVKLMFLTFANRHNPKYFEHDLGYWK